MFSATSSYQRRAKRFEQNFSKCSLFTFKEESWCVQLVETENGYYAVDSSRISENVHYLLSKKSLGVYSLVETKNGYYAFD